MTTKIEPITSTGLALYDLMIAIALVAVAFAFLPDHLAAIMTAAVAVTGGGILIGQWLRWPIITNRPGAWKWLPWVVWFLMLMVCPAAMAGLGALFPYQGPSPFARSRPWAADLVDILCCVHLGLSVIASVAVVVLARRGYRWVAWFAILVIGGIAIVAALCAAMSTTGISL